MTRATETLAKRIRDHARRSIDHHVEPMRYAVVKTVDPLSADLGGQNLSEDDLVLGYTARRLDADMGIEVGDTLVVQIVDHEFLVVEVLTDRDLA